MCEDCNQSYILKYNEWCQPCYSHYFQNNFKKWTSKNIEIDRFLQEIQCKADSPNKIIEWIPYNRLEIISQIGKGGFGTVFSAIWLDGPIRSWNINNQNWNRILYYPVALKFLKNSNNLLLKEVSYYLYLSMLFL